MKFFSRKKEEDFLIEEPQNENIVIGGSTQPEPAHLLTAKEVISSSSAKPKQIYSDHSALDSLKKRMQQSAQRDNGFIVDSDSDKSEKINTSNIDTAATEEKAATEPATVHKTLLEKCKPFITDEDGRDSSVNRVPLYKLESVAQILENDSKKTIDRLAEKYDITVDYLGKKAPQQPESEEAEIIPSQSEPEQHEKIEINAHFKNVQSSVPFSLSELENDVPEKESETNFSDTATITFTPVADSTGAKPKIIVSSNTQSIDLTGEIAPIAEAKSIAKSDQITLEKNEFEEFAPESEIKTTADIRKHIRLFSILKRRSFLAVTFSVLLTLILAFVKLPFMSGVVLGKTQNVMTVCTVLTGLIVLINMDMFLSITKIFSKKSNADVCCSLASLFVLAYAITGIITKEIIIDILLLLAIILSIRALGKFRKDSYMLSNLKQIASSAPKNAVRLIDDSAVTFAMAKNSIDGDTLIAVPQKCNSVTDYIKYSTFGTFLNGKLPLISVLSLIISAMVGFAAAKSFGNISHGLYAACVIHCFSALPSLFFIKDFPLYAAAKKLNKKGCMIAGQTGAQHLEMANALLLNSIDIFPSGTVTLHQMKVLSENDLDKTILRAASLTECLNSPLSTIFKKIAGESQISSFPDSDTIKYEEKMGISGWVDDELLFIGNRTLMEAHGISVPDIEVDRKILRGGYFPVYVANADKVCALLVVQYSVDHEVCLELRRLTKIGVTLLINNTDPNITDQMICDYMGLYDDSVKIITNAGYHMYKNAVTHRDSCSAPATFRYNNLMLAKILNCANKIRRSNTLLTILYVLSAILGIMIFAYSSFAGTGTLLGPETVLLYSLICTALSYLLYLIDKP